MIFPTTLSKAEMLAIYPKTITIKCYIMLHTMLLNILHNMT